MTTQRAERNQVGCWPTGDQELLLRTALGKDAEAVTSWLAWLTQHGIEDLDSSSLHLLPAVYRNLRDIDSAAPEMTRLRGTYRYTWYRNQELMRELAPVLTALATAGIDTLALDDLALATGFYRDYGYRPITQVRIVVRQRQMSDALEVLQGLGWRAAVKSLERCLQGRSAVDVWKPGSRQAVLHWRAFDAWTEVDQEELAWGAAQPFDLGETTLHVLCPADQLVRLCGYGVRRDVVPPTQWIVDSVAVLRSKAAAFEWERVAAMARVAQVSHPVADALTYLRDRHDVEVPRDVLQLLRSAPPSRLEQIEYDQRLQRPALRRQLAVHWYRHTARHNCESSVRIAAAFPTYLREVWDLDHLWEVPLRAGRAGARRGQALVSRCEETDPAG